MLDGYPAIRRDATPHLSRRQAHVSIRSRSCRSSATSYRSYPLHRRSRWSINT